MFWTDFSITWLGKSSEASLKLEKKPCLNVPVSRKPDAGAEELQQQVEKEPEKDEKASLVEQERIALQQRCILAMKRLDLLRMFQVKQHRGII